MRSCHRVGAMSKPERAHGMCGNCRERFHLDIEHVAYGGLLWCTEKCLAEFVAERGLDAETVEAGLEHRSVDGGYLDG